MGRQAGSRRRRTRADRRKQAGLRAAMLGILMVVCILCLVLFVKGQKLRAQISQNDRICQELNEQIAAEEARTADIEALRDYYESEDFIRQAARDRLGLIEEGQIVFRSAN